MAAQPSTTTAVTLTFHGTAPESSPDRIVGWETPAARIAVDCGMFQGPNVLKELNYHPLPSEHVWR